MTECQQVTQTDVISLNAFYMKHEKGAVWSKVFLSKLRVSFEPHLITYTVLLKLYSSIICFVKTFLTISGGFHNERLHDNLPHVGFPVWDVK